jgi:branched-chain amino acid transport system ATP-binding protein
MSAPLLQVQDLHAFYGKSHILHGVHFDIAAGEIVSLLGRNGVGRSTTIKAIMGDVPPRGSIRFRDREIAGLKPHQVARLGLGYVPENRDIFPTLTVRQNLYLGQKSAKKTGRWSMAEMFKVFPRLEERADTPAGVLSGGEQQMLTIARTLMGSPEVLLLDEPSEGLAPLVVEMLEEQLRRLKAGGLTMMLTEQNVGFVSELGDRVYILENGTVRYQGAMREFLANDHVRRAYLAV